MSSPTFLSADEITFASGEVADFLHRTEGTASDCRAEVERLVAQSFEDVGEGWLLVLFATLLVLRDRLVEVRNG